MSAGLMTKLKSWVSGDPYDDEMMDYMDEYEFEPQRYPVQPADVYEYQPEVKKTAKRNLKVVDHPSSSSMQQVIVLEPKAFEEALDMIDHLRNRKSVLLNLHMLDMAQSQRVVDFLSGATHAIEGHQQRVGDGVFMFTPNNVMIESHSAIPFTSPQQQPVAEWA